MCFRLRVKKERKRTFFCSFYRLHHDNVEDGRLELRCHICRQFCAELWLSRCFSDFSRKSYNYRVAWRKNGNAGEYQASLLVVSMLLRKCFICLSAIYRLFKASMAENFHEHPFEGRASFVLFDNFGIFQPYGR